MKNLIRVAALILLAGLLLPTKTMAQDARVIWSDGAPSNGPEGQLAWTSEDAATLGTNLVAITGSAAVPLPAMINHIKNVKADLDLDDDGKMEFMMPIFWDDGGVNRRSVYVFENTGDDAK